MKILIAVLRAFLIVLGLSMAIIGSLLTASEIKLLAGGKCSLGSICQSLAHSILGSILLTSVSLAFAIFGVVFVLAGALVRFKTE